MSVQLSCPGSNNAQVTFGNTVFKIHYGVDYTGGNLVQVTSANFNACITACSQNSTCKDVVYTTTNRKCYQKSTFTSGRANTNAWSAVRASVDSTTCDRDEGRIYTDVYGRAYQISCGKDSPANDISKKSAKTVEACLTTCDTTAGCVAASYYKGICYLKRRVAALRANAGVTFAQYLSSTSTTSVPPSTKTTTTTTTTTTTLETTVEPSTTTNTTERSVEPPNTTTNTSETTVEPSTTTTTLERSVEPPTTTTDAVLCTESNAPVSILETLRSNTDEGGAFISLPAGYALSIYGQSSSEIKLNYNGVVGLFNYPMGYPLSNRNQINIPWETGSNPLTNYTIVPFWKDLAFMGDRGHYIRYTVNYGVLSIDWFAAYYSRRFENKYYRFSLQQDMKVPNVVRYVYHTIEYETESSGTGVKLNSTNGINFEHAITVERDTRTIPGSCYRVQ